MKVFAAYLAQVEDESHRVRMAAVLNWVKNEFSSLKPKIGWNQPMFTDHGTFFQKAY